MFCGKDIVVALLKGDVVTFATSIPILYLPACYLDFFFYASFGFQVKLFKTENSVWVESM